MQPELALEKLNELREVVDGDVAEMVDGLATILILQQDMSNPMLGAKVTLYMRPPMKDRVPIKDEDELPDGWEDNWQYSKSYNKDEEIVAWYAEKENEDDPDLMEYEAIVIEGNVAGDAPEGDLWDPNKGQYMQATDYPLGTVNVVVAKDRGDLIKFSDQYVTEVEVYTSITPADGDPSPHEYTPGW